MANVIEVSLTSNADEVREALGEAVQTALEAIGMQAESYAKMLCPVGATGNLRNSITHDADEDSAVIGTNVEYAPYVELGHHLPNGGYVEPRPYLAPAVENHVDEYRQIIEERLRNG